MKSEQVDQALCQKFITERERIVFWNDPNGEFVDYITQGLPVELANVTVLDPQENGGLSTKLLLENEDQDGQYLLYSSREKPLAEDDWLLDVRLYAAEFHADVSSIWLHELGLNGLGMREHIQKRAVFFRSQGRIKSLRKLISGPDDEIAIDLKMMAVLTGSSVADFFSIFRALCHGHMAEGEFDLLEETKVLGVFGKMGLAERFWQMVADGFGYQDAAPTIAGVLRRIFVSDLIHQANGLSLDAFAQFKLPPKGGQSSTVCLTQWRDSSVNAASYDSAAMAVASDLHLSQHIGRFPLKSLQSVFTFWDIELEVVKSLKNRVLEEAQAVNAQEIAGIASERKAGHWLGGPGRDTPERKAVADAYDAIVSAAELFSLHAQNQNKLTFLEPAEMIIAYRDELFRFDQLYRKFCFKAKGAQRQGWDLLKPLAREIEQVYGQGFLQPFGLEWGRFLDDGFLSRWELDEFLAQQNFYAKNIRPYLRKVDRRRAYVIISDAFRYEAAQELVQTLNGKYRMNAELSAMLGVLPSYTDLGMASLLPHKSLSYSQNGDVLVDGKSSAGTLGRDKQLATVNGMACQAKNLMDMKKEEAREFTSGKRVVYIYHNVIDARGDTASTENETFEAVEDCIRELVELVQFCVNTLNASNVWITADHGFLFREGSLDLTNKTGLDHKPENAVKSKKRYVIGPDLGVVAEAHHGSISVTAGIEGAMDFWIPRGDNRFHFSGGARFVHGGAMPQEMLIPLVTVSHIRGKEKDASRSEKVSVQILGDRHRITTPKYRFEIMQTEAVGERRKPITLNVAVYDGPLAVTSVKTVVLDSTAGSIEQWKKPIILELCGGEYDKSKPYRLILRDAETDAEVQSMPVVIDRSFDDDF